MAPIRHYQLERTPRLGKDGTIRRDREVVTYIALGMAHEFRDNLDNLVRPLDIVYINSTRCFILYSNSSINIFH